MSLSGVFCSSGFKCSRPSIAVEGDLGCDKKSFTDHWCKATTINSIQTQYNVGHTVEGDRYK